MSNGNEPEWIKHAKSCIGITEAPGPKNNPEVVSFFAEVGQPSVRDDSTAWCSAYVGAMLKRAGIPNTGSLAARSYLKYGIPVDNPEIGDIVVFSRGNSTWEGHVGFWMGENDTSIKVLGGNQNNKVSIASYSKTRLLGYRRPVQPTAPALRAAGSQDIAASDSLIKWGGGTILTAAVAQAAPSGPAVPAAAPTPTVESLQELGLISNLMKGMLEGFYGALAIYQKNIWISSVVVSVVMVYVGWRIRQTRIARAERGDPLSNQKG